jgi:myo-inositol 2-dehydrogenase/D-chiro-inositol 1-dehydrogenase
MRAMVGGPPTLKIGLIGCGGIARQFHLRILDRFPQVDLVAVADPRAEARERASVASGAAAYEDSGELLARDDVEAVVICAENRVHAELATRTAAAGKAFYLEKPIAVSPEDGRRAVAAADAAGVPAVIGYQFRQLPLYREVRRRLASGALGEVRMIRTRYCEPVPTAWMPDWKRRRETGGGVLMDLGTHHFDLARWFLGEEVASVEDVRIESERTEQDSAWVRGRMSGGAGLEAEFSFCRGRSCDWEFDCERGILSADRYSRLSMLLGHPRRGRARRPGAIRARIRELPIPRREASFRLSLLAFVDHLQGKPRELPGLEDGLRSLEVVVEAEAVAGMGAGVA